MRVSFTFEDKDYLAVIEQMRNVIRQHEDCSKSLEEKSTACAEDDIDKPTNHRRRTKKSKTINATTPTTTKHNATASSAQISKKVVAKNEEKTPPRFSQVENEEKDEFEVDFEADTAPPANDFIMQAHQERLQKEEAKSVAVSAKNPTYDDVKAVVLECLEKHGNIEGAKRIRDVLKVHKVDRVDEVKPEHYSHFIQKVRSVV